MNKIKLALADDEELFRNGLRVILERHASFEVLFAARDGEQLLNILQQSDQPDVILLDLRMKGMDGTETANHLKELYPGLKIIVLSSHYREAFLGYMFKLGVNAFLPKNISPDTLVHVIHQVYDKGLYFTDDQLKGLQEQLHSGQKFPAPLPEEGSDLTRREKEVLKLICDQYTNAEIADKLFISTRTVEGHRNNLLLKTGAKNTVGLVLYALFHRLIDWEGKLAEWEYTDYRSL